jgi:hypothetical protein
MVELVELVGEGWSADDEEVAGRLRASDNESGIERAQSSAGKPQLSTCKGGMQQRSEDVKLDDGARCDEASEGQYCSRDSQWQCGRVAESGRNGRTRRAAGESARQATAQRPKARDQRHG